MTPDGTIDIRKVPDQIPVLDRDGQICGFVSKFEIFRAPSAHEREAIMRRQESLERRPITNSDGNDAVAVIDPPVSKKCG